MRQFLFIGEIWIDFDWVIFLPELDGQISVLFFDMIIVLEYAVRCGHLFPMVVCPGQSSIEICDQLQFRRACKITPKCYQEANEGFGREIFAE